MKKPFFEPIDFIINNDIVGLIYLGSKIHVDAACRIANAKLEKEIQSWITVYSCTSHKGMSCALWSNENHKDAHNTHTAKLAFIEELPKKECVHEPKVSVSIKGLDLPKATHLHQIPEQFYCLKCGVELVPTSWSAK